MWLIHSSEQPKVLVTAYWAICMRLDLIETSPFRGEGIPQFKSKRVVQSLDFLDYIVRKFFEVISYHQSVVKL